MEKQCKEKQCKECNKILPLTAFPGAPRAKDGRANTCRNCKEALLDMRRRPSALALTPAQERDVRYVKLIMRHGYSSACFYLRMKAAGYKPDQAVTLAEAAFSNNDQYGRLRRQLGVRWRTK